MAETLSGRWRIVEMELWDSDAIDLLGPGFIHFGANGEGEFQFIAVRGMMDVSHGERDGAPHAEFSWDGDDEGDPTSGRGWATLAEDGSIRGRIFIHMGDDSGFRGVRTER